MTIERTYQAFDLKAAIALRAEANWKACRPLGVAYAESTLATRLPVSVLVEFFLAIFGLVRRDSTVQLTPKALYNIAQGQRRSRATLGW